MGSRSAQLDPTVKSTQARQRITGCPREHPKGGEIGEIGVLSATGLQVAG